MPLMEVVNMEIKENISFISGTIIFIIGLLFMMTSHMVLYFIFFSVGLGLASLRINVGVSIMCLGLFLSTITLFKYMNIPLLLISIALYSFGLYYGMIIHPKKFKKEIKSNFMKKYNIENEDISIEVLHSLEILYFAKKKFGTYINPSIRLIKVKWRNTEEKFFYNFRKKEFYEVE